MKQILIVWLAVILLVIALVFPPYGFTGYTVTITETRSYTESNRHEIVPWTYVAHRFILSRPPTKEAFDDLPITVSNKDFVYGSGEPDLRVSWLLVGIEALIIVFLAAGAIFTVRHTSHSA